MKQDPSKVPLTPGQATLRVKRATTRLLRELVYIRYDHVALKELSGRDHAGVDFFFLAQNGIHSDRLVRLMRVFDDHRDAASFWYLHKCLPTALTACLQATGVTLNDVKGFSTRLRPIRDKVFVHIDRDAVFDPKAVYRQANIKGREILRVTEAVWAALNDLYQKLHGHPFQQSDQYAGNDIDALHRFYVKWKWPGAPRPTAERK